MLLIDARYLAQPPSGIPRYTLNLLDAIRTADPGRRVRVLLHPAGVLPETLASHAGFDAVTEPHLPRAAGEVVRWRGRLRRLQPDVVHCPDAFAPLWPGPAVMVTLHDAIPLMPELSAAGVRSKKEKFRRLWRNWLQLQCRRADAVLTVSRHSANDLQRLLQLPPGKLHVVPVAVPPPSSPDGSFTHDKTSDHLTPATPYLLCVGRFDPYKNTTALVEAFAQLPPHLRLVFVGPLDPRFPQTPQRAAELGLSDRVTFTGSIDDATLQRLYAHATALVMPSRYEGFGLPAIEAMHHGLPVIASDAGSLPEIVGDAALAVDATQPPRIAQAVQRILDDPSLRSRLIASGKQRAAQFSLAEVGVAYLDVVDRLLALTRRSPRSTMRP